MSLTAATVYEEFLAGLSVAIKSLDVQGNDRVWTEWVKSYFTELGERRGERVLRTDPEKQESEFLLDLCWMRETGMEYAMQLGMECEWGYSREAVLYDFRKLLHIKAPVKVVVCALSEAMQDRVLDEMCDLIKKLAFRITQEQYLVINLPDSNVDVPKQLTFTGDEISAFGQRRALRKTEIRLGVFA